MTATDTRNKIESFIENILAKKDYQFVDSKKFKPATYLEQPIYSRKVRIGKSIYGTDLLCDFIVYHPQKHPNCLVIEARWQESSGTVDEKYPYLSLNIKQQSPYESIIVLDGHGYRNGAEKWLKEQVGARLRNVFNMSEFNKWVEKDGL